MNFVDQLDPELRIVVEKLPTDRPLDLNKIPAARAKMKKMVTAMLASLPGPPFIAPPERGILAQGNALGSRPFK